MQSMTSSYLTYTHLYDGHLRECRLPTHNRMFHGRENVATQQEWSFPVPIDEPEMWSEPAADEKLHVWVFRCVGSELVGARIEGTAVGVTR